MQICGFADALDKFVIALLVFGIQIVLILDVINLRLELLKLVLDFRELRAEVQHIVPFGTRRSNLAQAKDRRTSHTSQDLSFLDAKSQLN